MTVDQKTLDKIKDTKQRKDILDRLKERIQDDDFLDKFKPKEGSEPKDEKPKRTIPFDEFKEGERFPGMEPFYRFPRNFNKLTPEEKRKEYERYLMLLESKKGTEKLLRAKGGAVNKFKRGGLAEATARLKAQELSAGGTVIKTKTVAIDKSPNSGLITQRGFGASRKT